MNSNCVVDIFVENFDFASKIGGGFLLEGHVFTGSHVIDGYKKFVVATPQMLLLLCFQNRTRCNMGHFQEKLQFDKAQSEKIDFKIKKLL